MEVVYIIGLFAGFILAILGNAMRQPEMDRYFRKQAPQNRREEKDLRQKNARIGLVLLGLGALLFIASLFAFLLAFLGSPV